MTRRAHLLRTRIFCARTCAQTLHAHSSYAHTQHDNRKHTTDRRAQTPRACTRTTVTSTPLRVHMQQDTRTAPPCARTAVTRTSSACTSPTSPARTRTTEHAHTAIAHARSTRHVNTPVLKYTRTRGCQPWNHTQRPTHPLYQIAGARNYYARARAQQITRTGGRR